MTEWFPAYTASELDRAQDRYDLTFPPIFVTGSANATVFSIVTGEPTIWISARPWHGRSRGFSLT